MFGLAPGFPGFGLGVGEGQGYPAWIGCIAGGKRGFASGSVHPDHSVSTICEVFV